MSTTPTVPIGLQKITPGSEIGSWGPIVNSNWDTINSYLAGLTPLPPQGFTATQLNKIVFASQCAGADASAKIQTAIGLLPAQGGTVYAGDLNDVGGTGSTTIDPGTKSVTIVLGPYTYFISQIILRTNLWIIGSGSGQGLSSTKPPTLLQAVGNNTTPPIVLSQTVGEGQEGILLKIFRLQGTVSNSSQNGIFISAPATGGLWYSRFEDLLIQGFAGIALDFEGPNGGGINQFSSFVNVWAFRTNGGSYALQIKGFANSLEFPNCEFDGSVVVAGGDGGTNINIADVSGGTFPPYNIMFKLLTCQWAAVGIQFAGCYEVSFDQLHMEGVFGCLLVGSGASFGSTVTVHDSGIYTSAANSGNGYIINVTAATANAHISISSTHIYATPDAFMKGSKGAITVGLGVFIGAEGSFTVQPTQTGLPLLQGAGSAGVAVTCTAKGGGTGPTTPQTIVGWEQRTSSGIIFYTPLFQ